MKKKKTEGSLNDEEIVTIRRSKLEKLQEAAHMSPRADNDHGDPIDKDSKDTVDGDGGDPL